MKRVMMLGFVMLFLAAVLWTSAPLTTSAQAAPAAPASFQVSSYSASQINLSWSAVSGATSYQVYRSTGTSTSYTKIATITTPAYKNTGLTAATRYNYKVRAVQGSTPGSFTVVKSAYTRPAAPTGLAAKTISTTQIDLSWTAVTGATSYQVYRSTGTSTTYAKIATITTPMYSDKGRVVGTRYNYKVLAANAGGTGAFSAVKTAYTKPAAPTGVTASKGSETQINLKWAKVTGATGYKVYVSKNGSSYAYKTTITSLTYSHTGLTAGGYSYKVTAVAGTSEGAQSAVSAKISVGGPGPTGLKATTASTAQINLTWNAVSGATQYRVSRSIGSSTTYSAIRVVTTTSLNDITLTPGVKYNYRVQALTGSLTSAYSATASAYTKPLAPTSFAATRANDTQIHLTWSMPTACTGYKLYVSVNGGSYAYLASVAVSTRQYDHSGLAAGMYQYRVTAVAGSIESAPTASAAVALPAPGLPAPTWVSATTVDYDSINLKWNAVAGAAKYYIYASTNASSGYGLFGEWVGTDCNANGLNANTTYYFKLSAVDENGKEGVKSAFIGATTDPAPPTPPQPSFYLYSIQSVGSQYRMNFYRSTSPIYPTAYGPTFNFYTGTSSSNLAYDCSCDLNEYFYMDVTPGQALWYGFTANYGPYASTMQKLNIAALGQPASVSANGVNQHGYVYMNWSSVYAAAKYKIYYSVGGPYPGQSWLDFKASAGSNLHFYGAVTGTSATLTGIPLGLTYYFFVVPADANGVEGWYCKYAISGCIY